MIATANPTPTGRPVSLHARRRARGRGFTYVGLIILVAIIGLIGATTLKLGALLQRRAAEDALLEVGNAFSVALKSYADASLPGQRKQPATLEELLRDPRFPGTRRHLRSIYPDPVTGTGEWGLVRALDKVGIVAVYSLSDAAPIKVGNFDSRFQQLDNKLHLSEWKFAMAGGAAAPTLAAPTVPAPAPATPAPQPGVPPLPGVPQKPSSPETVTPLAPKPEAPVEPKADPAAPPRTEAPSEPPAAPPIEMPPQEPPPDTTK